MAGDNYAEQMQAAANRELARTAAEGNCTARTKDDNLCRRPVAKELLAKGIYRCRLHVSATRQQPRPKSSPRPSRGAKA